MTTDLHDFDLSIFHKLKKRNFSLFDFLGISKARNVRTVLG